MTRTSLRVFSMFLMLGALSLASACSEDVVDPGDPWTFVVEAPEEQPEPPEQIITPPEDPPPPPEDMETEPEPPERPPVFIPPFDQALWERENPCDGVIDPPQIDQEFYYPSFSGATKHGKRPRSEQEEWMGDARQINTLTFDESLRPNRRVSYLFRNNDEDVHIYLHTIIQEEDVERSAGIFTVMVDYKPVEVIYNYEVVSKPEEYKFVM